MDRTGRAGAARGHVVRMSPTMDGLAARRESPPECPEERTSVRRILHIIAASEVGGAESVVRSLARAQQTAGARVSVVPILPGSSTAADFLRELGEAHVGVHPVQISNRGYLSERRRFAALIDELSPDVVHSHGYRADVVDALSARHRAAIVSTVHGFTGGMRNRVYQWLQCRAYRQFDAVVAVSEPLGRHLATRIGRTPLHVLPNAYESSSFALPRARARSALGIPPDAFCVGWVGRISPEKGPDVLVDMVSELKTLDSLHVAMIGDGPLGNAMKAYARQLRVQHAIRWCGRLPNADQFFSAFDVLVVSSRTEGTPMVVLEAMASNVPIVATRVGGIPNMLSQDTAVLVPPESPVELAEAVRAVFMDPGAAQRRTDAARQRLDTAYRVDSWVSRYDKIYAEALENAAHRFQ